MKKLTLILAILIMLSSCSQGVYRTETYKIKAGQSPAEAYRNHWNKHLK